MGKHTWRKKIGGASQHELASAPSRRRNSRRQKKTTLPTNLPGAKKMEERLNMNLRRLSLDGVNSKRRKNKQACQSILDATLLSR